MCQNTWVSFGRWLQGEPDTIWVCVDTVCAVCGTGLSSGRRRRGIHYQFSISNGDCHIGSDILSKLISTIDSPVRSAGANHRWTLAREDNIFFLSADGQTAKPAFRPFALTAGVARRRKGTRDQSV